MIKNMPKTKSPQFGWIEGILFDIFYHLLKHERGRQIKENGLFVSHFSLISLQ